jgi:hypothetical protein
VATSSLIIDRRRGVARAGQSLSEKTFSVIGGRLDFVRNERGVVTEMIFHAVEGDMKAVRKPNAPEKR